MKWSEDLYVWDIGKQGDMYLENRDPRFGKSWNLIT